MDLSEVMKEVPTGEWARQACNSSRIIHLWLPIRTEWPRHGSYLRSLQMAVWGSDLLEASPC